MPPKIISVATHKGGTGKTVTSMALAAAFARAGKKTLLVDLDPQGHSTLGLGVELEDNALTLRDLFTDPPRPVKDVIHRTHIEGLDIIPSNIRLERVAQLLVGRPKREGLLLRALQPVVPEYRFILIDCPPSLGPLTEAAIAAANFLLVPCQMEARATDGLQDLHELVDVIKEPGFQNWRILLTKIDGRKTTTNETMREALLPWKDYILQTEIPQSEPLNQAQIARTDIYTFEPSSKGAHAYQALAQELMAYGD
jgi:chromosome partitioning protein